MKRTLTTVVGTALICFAVTARSQETAPPTATAKLSVASLAGRSDATIKAALLKSGGGNEASEKAVAAALRWIVNHQMADGGWNFDHRKGTCQGRCINHGAASTVRNGATAMALLALLGAGHTHQAGDYQREVKSGLMFLGRNQKDNGSFHESGGTMYSHGMAAIALCEAYAMTRDKNLLAAAQRSVDFISEAQDPVGGGWRYNPKQAGDTSVLGWQIAALKSAHMSYLTINPNTIKDAVKFLDSVSTENGTYYGYTTNGKGTGTTAIGLLCRMYMGWKHSNPALERGVQFLSKTGPNKNMYYNYYATQVMRHYDGPLWKKWNGQMKPMLVESQNQEGHQTGSWYFGAGVDHGAHRGGRLYTTVMATLILEVYYRHGPLYEPPPEKTPTGGNAANATTDRQPPARYRLAPETRRPLIKRLIRRLRRRPAIQRLTPGG